MGDILTPRNVIRMMDEIREKYKFDKRYNWDCPNNKSSCPLYEAMNISEQRATELTALALSIFDLAGSLAEALDIALSTAKKYGLPENETTFLLSVIVIKVVTDSCAPRVGIIFEV